MDALYANAHFDDLDLDARSQWVDKGKKIGVATMQAISTKLNTTVGLFFFLHDLDLANGYKYGLSFLLQFSPRYVMRVCVSAFVCVHSFFF